MENAAIIAAWAAAFAALVGPMIGVVMANSFSRHESIRTVSARLFSQIVVDANQFASQLRDAVKCHNSKHSAQIGIANTQLSNMASHDVVQKQEMLGRAIRREQRVHDMFSASMRELRNSQSMLESDILSLNLLFERKASACQQQIKQLIKMAETIEVASNANAGFGPGFDLEIQFAVNAIIDELKPLYETVRRADPLKDAA